MNDEWSKMAKDNKELEKLERSLKNGGNLKSRDISTPKKPSSSTTEEVKKTS